MADTWYVRKSGNDANGGTDPDTDAKLTIAGGQAVSSAGDTIDIGIGTFAETITANGGGLTYQGAGMYLTIVTGDLYYTYADGWGSNTFNDFKISGLTGRIVWLRKTATQTFNRMYLDAGGAGAYFMVYSNSGSSVLNFTDCIICNFGAGSYCFYVHYDGVLTLTGCVCYDFVAEFLEQNNAASTVTIKNCILSEMDVGYDYNAGTYSITYTCRHNFAGAQPTWGTGCINADPLFVDPAGGNFSLQADSPCINAGQA